MSFETLRHKLNNKRRRVDLRYKFYEMKNTARDLGMSTPPSLAWLRSALGWNAKAVDSLADRLVVRKFKDGADFYDLQSIYELNNMATLTDSAILSALIASCSFIAVSQGDDGFPRLEVIDGGNATGEIDPMTGFLTEGYAVLERDKMRRPVVEAYYTAEATYYFESGKLVMQVDNAARYPLLVPIIFRPDARRPFGHSRISRACMEYTTSALRTIKRSEIAAEFFSFPQRYVTGLDSDDVKLEKWRATMSSLLQYTVGEDGEDHVKLGQFPQGSMTPHADQMRMFASLFAGETGLTLDDLGFPTSNPTSADAIRSSHENLRLTARKAQRTFEVGFKNAGLLAASLRDGQPYYRNQINDTALVWAPIFEPDASMLGQIGDGLAKIQMLYPDAVTADTVRELLGIG